MNFNKLLDLLLLHELDKHVRTYDKNQISIICGDERYLANLTTDISVIPNRYIKSAIHEIVEELRHS